MARDLRDSAVVVIERNPPAAAVSYFEQALFPGFVAGEVLSSFSKPFIGVHEMLPILMSRSMKHFKSVVICGCLIAAAQTSAWAGAITGGGPPPPPPYSAPDAPSAPPVAPTGADNVTGAPTPTATPNGFDISGGSTGTATATTVTFEIDTTQVFHNVQPGFFVVGMGLYSTFTDNNPSAIPGQQNFAEKTGFLEEPFVKFG